MADNQVNLQITDAVTQVNIKTVGESPWEALGFAYQALTHSTSLEIENAKQSQGGMQHVGNSVTSVK
ncbi:MULTISPECIES: RebB family R body protein [Methylobacter]